MWFIQLGIELLGKVVCIGMCQLYTRRFPTIFSTHKPLIYSNLSEAMWFTELGIELLVKMVCTSMHELYSRSFTNLFTHKPVTQTPSLLSNVVHRTQYWTAIKMPLRQVTWFCYAQSTRTFIAGYILLMYAQASSKTFANIFAHKPFTQTCLLLHSW